MGLLDRIFGYKRIKLNIDKTAPVPNANSSCNENCVKLMHFFSCINKMLGGKRSPNHMMSLRDSISTLGLET